ncbi:hypothetical protein ACROAE_07255 [Shewanella sp. MF05960]|uniref:hypothetical protein n=1 Tax=Shewanella sp. MF05960 TaxID=3434874 RepID=UPI003D7A7ADB
MSTIRIIQSVGLGGTNNLNDVKAVQTALNKLLKFIPPTKSLIVDGRLGSRPGQPHECAFFAHNECFQYRITSNHS